MFGSARITKSPPSSTSVWQRPSSSITKPTGASPKSSLVKASIPPLSSPAQIPPPNTKPQNSALCAPSGTPNNIKSVKPGLAVDSSGVSETTNGAHDMSSKASSTPNVQKRNQVVRSGKGVPGPQPSAGTPGEKHAQPSTRAWGPPGSMQVLLKTSYSMWAALCLLTAH